MSIYPYVDRNNIILVRLTMHQVATVHFNSHIQVIQNSEYLPNTHWQVHMIYATNWPRTFTSSLPRWLLPGKSCLWWGLHSLKSLGLIPVPKKLLVIDWIWLTLVTNDNCWQMQIHCLRSIRPCYTHINCMCGALKQDINSKYTGKPL